MLSFHNALENFILYLEAAGRSPRTIGSYKQRLEPVGAFLLKQKRTDISEVTYTDLDKYVVKLYRSDLSPVTVADYIQSIKTFFGWCVSRRHLSSSPAEHLVRPRINHNAANKAISQNDLETLIKISKDNGRILEYTMLMFLADTGCRVGELCSLNKVDLDLERFEAQVLGKTGERIVDFTQKTAHLLDNYLSFYRFNNDEEAVFTNKNGRITYFVVYGRMRRLAAKTSVKKYNPQAIRHRVGQGWIDQGANLELVRLKLGHNSITTTAMFYANQDRERIKAATNHYSLVGGIVS